MLRLDCRLLHMVKNDCEHSHSYAQILLPVNTEVQLKNRDVVNKIGIRELCFIPPDMPHKCCCGKELIIINIPSTMINKWDLQALSRKTVIPIEDSMIQLTELIRAEAKGNFANIKIPVLLFLRAAYRE